ncbi:MAG TPA: helix-turn-helix domain-containing protein, partial [Kofleriaceae bacterium]|nr:helix-turn-helix domain-containing protein [Kofleriaceae bacterium]
VETILGIEVIVHGLQCDACEEMTIDADEARRIDREVATRIARRGIRSGVELKLVRKAAGYRAAELATLLGVTSKTVSRWERGEVEIPRSAAYVVGDLLEQPRRSRQRLEALG